MKNTNQTQKFSDYIRGIVTVDHFTELKNLLHVSDHKLSRLFESCTDPWTPDLVKRTLTFLLQKGYEIHFEGADQLVDRFGFAGYSVTDIREICNILKTVCRVDQ